MAGAPPSSIADLVVVIPGILGSKLERRGVPVWDVSAGGLLRSLATFGREIKRLQLPLDLGDGAAADGVTATGLLGDLHVIPGVWSPIKGYIGLLEWLRREFHLQDVEPADPDAVGNLLVFAYDWRLSNRYTAARLKDAVEPALRRWRIATNRPDAKLILICHSMGGLVARYYLEVLGGAEHTRRLVTLGTPYRGALDALTKLTNGAPIQLGPLAFDFSAFASSLPSLHQLLPAYACLDAGDGAELKYLTERPVGGLGQSAMVADAVRFHQEIEQAVERRGVSAGYTTHPVLGVKQPTWTTARVTRDGRIEPLRSYQGDDEGGDGTVPRLSARPREMAADDPVQVYCAEQHGSLILHGAARDHLWGVLTARPRVYRDAPSGADLSLELPELIVAGERLVIQVTTSDDRLLLAATCTASDGQERASQVLTNAGGGRYTASIDGLAPDIYAVSVGPPAGRRGPSSAKPVTGHVLVWDPALGSV